MPQRPQAGTLFKGRPGLVSCGATWLPQMGTVLLEGQRDRPVGSPFRAKSGQAPGVCSRDQGPLQGPGSRMSPGADFSWYKALGKEDI